MCGSRYEPFRVATLALVFTWMRLQVIDYCALSFDVLFPVVLCFELLLLALQPGFPE